MNKDHSKVRAEARREGTKTLLEFHAERATRNVSTAPSAQWRQQRAEHGAACVPFEADATEPSGRPVCAARAVGEAGARKAFRGLWHEAPTVLSQAPERAPGVVTRYMLAPRCRIPSTIPNQKAITADAAHNQLTHSTFRSQRIERNTRVQFASTLCLPRRRLVLATWLHTTPAKVQTHQVCARTARPQRRVSRMKTTRLIR